MINERYDPEFGFELFRLDGLNDYDTLFWNRDWTKLRLWLGNLGSSSQGFGMRYVKDI